jgi:hypothetical protein
LRLESGRDDGVPYEHDVVIDRGKVRKRKKGALALLRDARVR